jgi:hypothetical protein
MRGTLSCLQFPATLLEITTPTAVDGHSGHEPLGAEGGTRKLVHDKPDKTAERKDAHADRTTNCRSAVRSEPAVDLPSLCGNPENQWADGETNPNTLYRRRLLVRRPTSGPKNG